MLLPLALLAGLAAIIPQAAQGAGGEFGPCALKIVPWTHARVANGAEFGTVIGIDLGTTVSLPRAAALR